MIDGAGDADAIVRIDSGDLEGTLIDDVRNGYGTH
jgi:hypothetical protein